MKSLKCPLLGLAAISCLTCIGLAALVEEQGSGDVVTLKIESTSMPFSSLSALYREESGYTYYYEPRASVEVALAIGDRTRVSVA